MEKKIKAWTLLNPKTKQPDRWNGVLMLYSTENGTKEHKEKRPETILVSCLIIYSLPKK